jgi:hypothetical protein
MRFDSQNRAADPARLEDEKRLNSSDEVGVVDEKDALCVALPGSAQSEGRLLVQSMRGRASTSLSTDELMKLSRED